LAETRVKEVYCSSASAYRPSLRSVLPTPNAALGRVLKSEGLDAGEHGAAALQRPARVPLRLCGVAWQVSVCLQRRQRGGVHLARAEVLPGEDLALHGHLRRRGAEAAQGSVPSARCFLNAAACGPACRPSRRTLRGELACSAGATR
jgi:hypothetical protein